VLISSAKVFFERFPPHHAELVSPERVPIDLERLQQDPDVYFAHKSGFMCKTTATEPDRLQALIARAQVDVA